MMWPLTPEEAAEMAAFVADHSGLAISRDRVVARVVWAEVDKEVARAALVSREAS